MKKHLLLYLFCIALLSACSHKDLCELHPHLKTVRVEFNWKNAPDADPEGMCVFFYPVNGGYPLRYDFIGKEGGQIEIEVGEYNVLCYNNDTEAIIFRGVNAFPLHEGYTREGGIFEPIYGNSSYYGPKAKDAEDERIMISPDMLWGCSGIGLTISDSENQLITFEPEEMVCTYTYEIRNVTNLKSVVQMCGTISGMASSLFIGTQELGEECITIPFEALSDGKETITGRFYTFGHSETNIRPHRMLFYFWLKNGEKYCYGTNGDKYDVTEQIHNAEDKRHVHIIVDGLDLPSPITNGNGFNPSFDDWKETDININI